MNTPALETERLILRKFTEKDLDDILRIYGDEETNTFLPWFPIGDMAQARIVLEEYQKSYRKDRAYEYAICLKEDNIPIGYVGAEASEDFEFSYALRKEFWHQGIATEASGAVIEQLRKDGIPYITATHDALNPASGAVMQRLGMKYRYSNRELWEPKHQLVTFRMYQLNLDGQEERVIHSYWDLHPDHFIEDGIQIDR